ncbi:MAG TPA: hypothetical protein VF523_06610 [Burkholderiales bacterium]
MQKFTRLALALGACISLMLLLLRAVPAQADTAAEQLERARLLRELLETRPDQQAAETPSLAGARIDAAPIAATERARRQQFEDAQWRALLGNQQAKIYAPASQAIPESQWRSQTFDRERRAQDLSADILRRSREYLSAGPH